MNYFSKISSLAELKKQYRKLAIENHPDKGGSTEAMQMINLEFEKLFAIWKDDTRTVESATGYESDYCGASAHEYTEYVYNEYRFRGSNYKGQSPKEVVDILRIWLKETYPRYKFSVTRKHYDSIYIYLIRADFEAFGKDSKCICSKDINHYHITKDKDLTERAREVMENVYSYVSSYNFDDSDVMTDYFHCNFYLHMGIGTMEKPYKIEIPKIQAKKGSKPEVFKHPEGSVHKAIRQALGKARFSQIGGEKYEGMLILGEDHYGSNGEHYFWGLSYSSEKMAQKRIEKLNAAGILCKTTGWNGGYIRFLGYTSETEAMLEEERKQWIEAKKAWDIKQQENEVTIEGAERLSSFV
jgi:curved DNA-binding protein CbpA